MLLQMPNAIDALCYEHHGRMLAKKVQVVIQGRPAQILAYVCPETGCRIQYNRAWGYFLAPNGPGLRRELGPYVRCPNDGLPMYLSEVCSEQSDYRLWRCQKCNANRSNGSLARAAGQPAI